MSLYKCLVEFLKDRGLEVSNNPMDDLIIPVMGGDVLRVPIVLLESAIDNK